MDSIFNNFLMILFMLLLLCFPNSTRPLCHVDESFALLKFKQSLTINEYASGDPSAYNKIDSWKLQGESNSDCCSWDGVECENKTGHVIGLELNSSFLFWVEIGSLSRLTALDLSQSKFSGNIPREISKLSKLVSLRVSENVDSSDSRLLKLENLTLSSLLQNLTRLEELDLGAVDLSSKVPDILANLSSLETLILRGCNLYGEFPTSIFHLPKLRVLIVRGNKNLSGHLPEFEKYSHLEVLSLRFTRFSGKLPKSIGNLSSLGELDLRGCNFSGSIPASMGNLSKLILVDLGSNSLSGQVPNLESLSKLEVLILSDNRMNVDTLIWLRNLTKLTYLFLHGIDLSGSILSVHIKHNHSTLVGLVSNNTLPKFKFLGLNECNLKGFPDFLRYQDELNVLQLAMNKIHGRIPTWFSNISKECLGTLELGENLLTGFDQKQDFLPWSNIGVVDLSANMMQGPIPIPPPSIVAYSVNNNSFSGKISPLLCNLSTLQILELSNNFLTGVIPPCLTNLSDSLSFLKLGGNNLHGPIPQAFKEGNKLKLLDLSHNKLNGKIPRLLENSKSLRFLDLSNNLLEDVFPFWLGSLPVLQIMSLGSNKLHGDIGNPESELDFPKLHICDLSGNNFTGYLPGKYFHTWGGMKSTESEEDKYMVEHIEFRVRETIWSFNILYYMTFTNKGLDINYAEIMNIFSAIDLSSNHFEGEIPEVIGTLQGLELLNLSNNCLIGKIPSSLGNLSNLESLDISRNKLSGKIPQQLVMLNFLAVFNVSENNLTGPIPKGNQFDTFQNNSYEGNLGLCGDPLSRKCENLGPTPLTLDEDEDDSDFPSGFDWVLIGLGVASGLIVGLVIGRFLCGRYFCGENLSRKG